MRVVLTDVHERYERFTVSGGFTTPLEQTGETGNTQRLYAQEALCVATADHGPEEARAMLGVGVVDHAPRSVG